MSTGPEEDSAAIRDLLPAPAQLALAWVILQSKPPQTCINDYLKQVSCHIRQASSDVISLQQEQLEAASFWKEAFEKVNAEKDDLLDRIANNGHQDQWESLQPNTCTSTIELGSKKRKLDGQDFVQANTQSKRSKIGNSDIEYTSTTSQDTGSRDKSHPGLRKMLRAVLRLRRSGTDDDHNLANITNNISILCHAAIETLTVAKKHSISVYRTRSTNVIDTPAACSKIALVYPCMLQALPKLETSLHEEDDNSVEAAYSRIVYMFQSILGHLHQLALGEVTRLEEEGLRRTKPRKSNIKAVKENLEERQQLHKQSCYACSNLLCKMLTEIDTSATTHCELLRGFMCALLDHIGSSLSLLVFSSPDAADTDVGVLPPEGLLHVSHIERQAAIAAAHIEAPYLVHVLKVTVDFVREKCPKTALQAKSIFNLGEESDLDQKPILQQMESILQNTLMRGVFGDEDLAFAKSLKRIDTSKEAFDEILEEIEDETETSNWFISQIWEILGWNVLEGTSLLA